MEIIIRKEQPGDEAAVRRVNLLAFDGAAEADIVDQLRLACPEALSLVALDGDHIVGHILFTPAVIGAPGNQVNGMGLAPMSVLPEYQGQGIGSQLARTGLEMLRQAGQPFVIVLGHPHYYPRFGFEIASQHGIASQYNGIPDEAFMILIFDQQALKGVSGVAYYRSEFDAAM
jgi:putative acetyltransferase